MKSPRTERRCLMFLIAACLCPLLCRGQDARAVHGSALAETNPEKKVSLLCQAADLDAKNAAYRNECDISKKALLASDRQSLQTAKEAISAQPPQVQKARRYAGYVSSLDQDLHREARDLLTKLDAPPPSNPPPPGDPAAHTEVAATRGNAQEAKPQPQPPVVTADVKNPQAPQVPPPSNPPPNITKDTKTKTTSVATALKPPDLSPEEKKKLLLQEAWSFMSRSNYDNAEKRFKQVLDLDPSNIEAKGGLGQITTALAKDPILLEKTLHDAIAAFYASNFGDAELRFNRYLGAEGGKKKGAAYFYLGATEITLALLDDPAKKAARTSEARDDFNQARAAKYEPLDAYVSPRILTIWRSGKM